MHTHTIIFTWWSVTWDKKESDTGRNIRCSMHHNFDATFINLYLLWKQVYLFYSRYQWYDDKVEQTFRWLHEEVGNQPEEPWNPQQPKRTVRSMRIQIWCVVLSVEICQLRKNVYAIGIQTWLLCHHPFWFWHLSKDLYTNHSRETYSKNNSGTFAAWQIVFTDFRNLIVLTSTDQNCMLKIAAMIQIKHSNLKIMCLKGFV